MDKQLVGELPDITQSSNDNEIMVITDAKYNQLRKEKISDFLTDMISKDETNALIKGADNKLFVTNFGNADNITSGTIDKDRLPAIEVGDLPDSGVIAETYPYPVNLQVNQKGQVVSVEAGEPGGNNANTDLSNLTEAGEKHFLNKTQITNCILEAPNGSASFEGTTITVKSGLKYLTGSGRNADRTLKNTENTLNDDKTINFLGISNSTDAVLYIYNNTAGYCPLSEVYRTSTKPAGNAASNQVWFDAVNNKIYYSAYQSADWVETTDFIIAAKLNVTDSVINSLVEEQPVELFKRSDLETVLRDIPQITAPYITKTYINGQSGYIKLADGTIIQWGTNGYPGGAYTTFDVFFPTPFSQNSYTPVLTARGGDNINASAMKLLAWYTDHMTVKYTGAGNNSGTINGITWVAIGK